MTRALLLGLALALLAACGGAPDRTTRDGDVTVIRGDGGGNIALFMARRAELIRAGNPVRIEGRCSSACTVFATMPNACLAPDALLRFHSSNIPAFNRIIGGTLSGESKALWSAEWSRSAEFTAVPARAFVRLEPGAKLCGAAP